jgi:hypothetical protein
LDTYCISCSKVVNENGVKRLASYMHQLSAAQHSVHPTGGSLRVFRQFLWLEAGSVKGALSYPTHQRVTPAVRLPLSRKGAISLGAGWDNPQLMGTASPQSRELSIKEARNVT